MELSEKTMNDVLSKVIVPENKNQLKKVLEIVDKCPNLEKIIVMEEKEAVDELFKKSSPEYGLTV